MEPAPTQETGDELVMLWRPVGPQELELIAAADYRAFPPRRPEQPIFYPVLTEEYAIQIARDWNAPQSGAGFVTRFSLPAAFLAGYEIHQVGGSTRSTGSRLPACPPSTARSWAGSRSSGSSTCGVDGRRRRRQGAAGLPVTRGAAAVIPPRITSTICSW